jgi:V/A-type H+/Na+-transporting ATPase subunit C
MMELFASTPLNKAAELGDAAATGGRLTEFERECDNAVNRYITAARSCGFGPEIVLAYLAAEENTTTAVRMVLTGRLAGVSREHMKERLRESYV